MRSDENDLGGYRKGGLTLRSDAEDREGYSEGRGRRGRGRGLRGGFGEEQRVRADLLGRHLTDGSRGGHKDLRAAGRGQREDRSRREPAEGPRENRARTAGREEYGKVGRGCDEGREGGRGKK